MAQQRQEIEAFVRRSALQILQEALEVPRAMNEIDNDQAAFGLAVDDVMAALPVEIQIGGIRLLPQERLTGAAVRWRAAG